MLKKMAQLPSLSKDAIAGVGRATIWIGISSDGASRDNLSYSSRRIYLTIITDMVSDCVIRIGRNIRESSMEMMADVVDWMRQGPVEAINGRSVLLGSMGRGCLDQVCCKSWSCQHRMPCDNPNAQIVHKPVPTGT